MNNEIKEENNVLEQKPINNSPLTDKKDEKGNKVGIIIALVILLTAAVGFICYDKFLNKEETPVPTPTVSPSPVPTDNNKSITILKEVKITSENQAITIGNNTFNIRNKGENEGGFLINDSLASDLDSINMVYVTNNFAFFIGFGQFDCVVYAIDSNGNEIKVEDNNYYIHDIKLDNGIIVGKGMTISDALDENSNATEIDLVVKYENNMITITPKK